jgi:hypothetical protein
MKYALVALAAVLVTAASTSAMAQPAPAPQPVSPPPATSAAAPAEDLGGMLKSCDRQLRTCESERDVCVKDATGVGFLGAAYIALWVVLMAFFMLVRARQKKLVAEMRSLRERLSALQGGS